MPTERCPICGNDSKVIGGLDAQRFSCIRCATFIITRSAKDFLEMENLSATQRAYASSWVRHHPGVEIKRDNYKLLVTAKPPSVNQRARLVLLHLEKELGGIGTVLNIPLGGDELQEWLAVSWSEHYQEVQYLIESFLSNETGHVEVRVTSTELMNLQITPKGYAYLEELQKAEVDSQIGFCAMWFDPSLNGLWTDAIEPAILGAGYQPLRIDKHQHNNRVDDEIITMIRRSKFVVSDMTGSRGGVYFEAGFAYGLNIPVIWTCRESDKDSVHFDTRQFAMTFWEPEKLAEFRAALTFRIEATLGRGTYQPPHREAPLV